MTIDEAKEKAFEFLSGIVDEEYPLAWVGEFIKEDATHIWIEGCLYAPGTNPEAVAKPLWVNKKTGKVMPAI